MSSEESEEEDGSRMDEGELPPILARPAARGGQEDEDMSSEADFGECDRPEEREYEGWTLSCFRYGHDLDARTDPPSLEAVQGLITEYRQRWLFRRDVGQLSCLGAWVWRELGLREGDWKWESFETSLREETYRLRRLFFFLGTLHKVTGGMHHDYLCDISHFFSSLQRFAREQARVYCAMQPMNRRRFQALETVGDGSEAEMLGNQSSIYDYKESDLKPWQNAFLFLRDLLDGKEYRRADAKFFVRISTPTGLPTLAFEPELKVEEFVAKWTPHDGDFKAWLWMTENQGNFRQMVEYMSTRPLPEAQDLRENCHLRSYAGDAYGRGAVVYDCAQDVAWPYGEEEHWPRMAEEINTVRRLLYDPSYECKPPTPEAVCCIHLDNVFPYDIAKEVRDVNPETLGLCWREAGAYECPMGEELEAPELAEVLHAMIPWVCTTKAKEVRGTLEPGVWGRTWKCVNEVGVSKEAMEALQEVALTEDRGGELKAFLEAGCRDVSEDMLKTCLAEPLQATSCLRTDAGYLFVPCYTPPRRVRAVLTREEWNGLVPFGPRLSPRRFVRHKACSFLKWKELDRLPEGRCDAGITHEALSARLLTSLELTQAEWEAFELTWVTPDCVVRAERPEDGSVAYFSPLFEWRYFRPHVGRTWRDCSADDVEHIYDCQNFTEHDKFMLLALKGRLFFHVGEKDNHQMTLMLEGVGGCGKSTIMQVQQSFWPPHLRGILSSNMQPQFGMSDVAEKEVIFCNEVSDELQVVQEEWQTSVSGEWGSYAVKNEAPLVVKWKGQHFWVGNSFPTRFKNKQGQVSRRLAGVLMSNPVKPRDGSILKTMFAERGALQRKEVLAYEEFVRQTGGIDPMSVPEKLPPAFEEYYRKGRIRTNPFEQFLDEGEYVRYEEGSKMLMNDLKELFHHFRISKDMGKATRWGEEIYRTAFNDRGISVMRLRTYVDSQGTEVKDAQVVVNLVRVAP